MPGPVPTAPQDLLTILRVPAAGQQGNATLAPGATVTLDTGIVVGLIPYGPGVVVPDRATAIGVVGTSSAGVWDKSSSKLTFKNFGGIADSVDFLCWYVHSRVALNPQDLVGQQFYYRGLGTAASAGSLPGGFAMFYGSTTGTDSEGNDYAATIAAGAPMNFPRSGPSAGSSPIVSSGAGTVFTVGAGAGGVYRITWQFSATEALQWALTKGGLYTLKSGMGQATGTSRQGSNVLCTLAAGDAVSLVNTTAATAATITPIPGGTHAQFPNIIFQQIA